MLSLTMGFICLFYENKFMLIGGGHISNTTTFKIDNIQNYRQIDPPPPSLSPSLPPFLPLSSPPPSLSSPPPPNLTLNPHSSNRKAEWLEHQQSK